MAPKPRWTVPVNMRLQDKLILDAALEIAKREGSDITTVFRNALEEFVNKRARTNTVKLDSFLDNSIMIQDPIYSRVFTPTELRSWSETSLLDAAKRIRSRKEELDRALREKGYFFRW